MSDKTLRNIIKEYYDASDENVNRILKILEADSYKRADQDFGFIDSDLARPMRMQLEYLKVQNILKQKGVNKTIVVFGGTRVIQKHRAELKLEKAHRAVSSNPDSKTSQFQLKVAESVMRKVKYYEESRKLAASVARYSQSHNNDLYVMTGGGPGVMEAANRGAFDCGEESIGLNIDLPFEQFPNPYVTPELCFSFRYFALRKLHFMNKAKALVAFPGGFGTFDELFEALTVIQTKTIPPIPIVLVGKQYWKQAVNFEFLAEEGVISSSDLNLFTMVETAEEAWESILNWYAEKGLDL
jgi:uncharacterized protein (TIGR00730 family)